MTPPRITPIDIGDLRADLSDWYRLPPDHPSAGQVDTVELLCYHIAMPGRSVLVDAAAYEFPVDLASMVVPGSHRPSLVEQLAGAGVVPTDITDVIITHPHFDHVNALTRWAHGRDRPAFPGARHYLGAADWRPGQLGGHEEFILGVVREHGLLTLVEGPLDLGDGLEILPAPGETPGHQIAHLQAEGVAAYFVGDLYHHPLEFAEGSPNVYWAEPESMKRSKAAFVERAANDGAPVYFAHIEAPYRVERVGTGVQWRALLR